MVKRAKTRTRGTRKGGFMGSMGSSSYYPHQAQGSTSFLGDMGRRMGSYGHSMASGLTGMGQRHGYGYGGSKRRTKRRRGKAKKSKKRGKGKGKSRRRH